MHSAFGQKNHIEKELHSLKSYRDTLAKKTCRGDTLKQIRCKEKTIEFLASKKKYLLQIDSVDKVIRSLNEKDEKYYYYLKLGKTKYFDWGECNTEVLGDSTTLTYMGLKDSDEDEISRKITIEKTERQAKFGFDLSGLTSGQTFYKEDLK